METITCRRCGRTDAPVMERQPFRSELGERLKREACADCWKEWLVKQTQLINHYGLDPREAQAREFLYAQIESHFFAAGDAEQVDYTKKGEISW